MRPLLHPLLAAGLLCAFVGGCTTKDSLLDDPGVGGSDGGAQGGANAGQSGTAGSAGATGGADSGGAGGRAGGGTAGTINGGSAGTEVGGSGAEGGDGDRGGSQSAGMGGDGSGGTEAGTGGTGAAGASGSNSCPPGQMWCPGCTIDSGMCASGCPGAACGPCESVESLEECEARTDCHSVFEDPGTCGCAGVGCCAHFARCADNDRADCTGANVTCEALTPFCDSPAYVNSYSGSCYEGCVAPKDCAPSPPTPCPPSVPVDGSACGGDAQCYYDACPEGGRAIATCSGRTWSVETGTSCAVLCSGFSQQCDGGQVCLVHAGGALQIDCVENGCGTGPILEQCAGNCPVSFTLYSGATVTCNTCPQGGCP